MSASEEERCECILEERALRLARAPVGLQARRVLAKVVVVSVGQERFALPVDRLREIVPAPPLAPLPGLAPWLPGIAQLRGEILCAVSLARWWGISQPTAPSPQPPLSQSPKEPFLVVLAGGAGAIGLLVEAVCDFRDLFEDELSSSFGAAPGQRPRPVRAMTRDLVAVLDVAQLLASPDLLARPSPPSTET